MENTIMLPDGNAPRLQHVPASAVILPKRRLLCATDLSPRSDRAVQRTALLAQQMNAEAMFMHTVDDSAPGRVIRMKATRAYLRLRAEGERAMKHAPHAAVAAVRLGTPLDAMIASASEYEPDLIVMARHRRRRMDALIGTTAERVIRSTRRSVLAVSGDAERPYERVMLATDLSRSSTHAARTVAELGMMDDADAWVVHAFGSPYQELILADNLNVQDAMVHRNALRDVIKRDVLRNLADAGVDLERVEVSAEQARPIVAIERAMERVQPDLLVIGVSRWGALKRILLGSVADQVFRNVNCDILAIFPLHSEEMRLRAA